MPQRRLNQAASCWSALMPTPQTTPWSSWWWRGRPSQSFVSRENVRKTGQSGISIIRPVAGQWCRRFLPRDNFDSRCRSVEDSNTLLKEKFTKVPLCCGVNGTLDVDSYTCSNGQELPKEVAACNNNNNNNNNNSPTRWPTATGRTSRA